MRPLTALAAIAVLGSVSCAHRADQSASPGASASFAYSVPVELGDAELYDGDAITISEILGSEPVMRPGGTFLVKGRYHLASHDHATLLFSVTTTRGDGRGPTPSRSRLVASRGAGEFALVVEMDSPGYPHLTFYGADGLPFGGVYFGNGDSLLRKKRWRYRERGHAIGLPRRYCW